MANCICGNIGTELISYFCKQTGLRVTVCSKCATRNGFTDKKKYEATPYNNITEQQNKTPEPNAN